MMHPDTRTNSTTTRTFDLPVPLIFLVLFCAALGAWSGGTAHVGWTVPLLPANVQTNRPAVEAEPAACPDARSQSARAVATACGNGRTLADPPAETPAP